jgi:hypothetical protein
MTTLSCAPVIKAPDPAAFNMLVFDASNFAVGAVLSSQGRHSSTKTIAFSGRKCAPAECSYPVHAKGMLAVTGVCPLCEWRHCLLGAQVLLCHQPPSWLTRTMWLVLSAAALAMGWRLPTIHHPPRPCTGSSGQVPTCHPSGAYPCSAGQVLTCLPLGPGCGSSGQAPTCHPAGAYPCSASQVSACHPLGAHPTSTTGPSACHGEVPPLCQLPLPVILLLCCPLGCCQGGPCLWCVVEQVTAGLMPLRRTLLSDLLYFTELGHSRVAVLAS